MALLNAVVHINLRPKNPSKATALVHVPNGGHHEKDLENKKTQEVIVVAMPSAPWFKVPGREAYGSRDTAKELIVARPPGNIEERMDISDALTALDRRSPSRLDNDIEAAACVHVTKSVPIGLLDTRTGAVNPFGSANDTYYLLAAKGENVGDLFLVDELWFSETAWNENLPEFKTAMELSFIAMNKFLSGPADPPAAAAPEIDLLIDNVGEPDGGIQVYRVSPDLKTRTSIGFAVGFPQYCRQDLPGGVTNIYGSPEWFKELTVTPNSADIAAARTTLPAYRLNNEIGAVGCAHVSKSVPVSTLTNIAGAFLETPVNSDNPDGFYTLVAAGNYEDPINQTGMFLASEIWIGDQAWPTTAQVFQDAMARAMKAKSPCK